jgi:hypothetical protein
VHLPPDLHPDFCSIAETTLTALVADYPQARFGGLRVYLPRGNDRSLGHVEGSDICINAFWFSEPRAKLDEAVLCARDLVPFGMPRWHGGVGSLEREAERLLTHEYFHVLAPRLQGYSAFADALHRAALDDPDLAVSGYALADSDECFAEVGAAMRMGGSGSPQVAEMQAFLTSSL